MANVEKHFQINFQAGVAKEGCIIKGDKFRITVLSEILIRLEYSEDNTFLDKPTEFALSRDFEVPKFRVDEDNKFIVITTSYFTLEYVKGKPFIGPKYAPDANLKISLNDTDKQWYFGHPEARNFYGVLNHLDKTPNPNDQLNVENLKNKVKEVVVKNKGLYSTDGFVSFDDSKSFVIEEDGSLNRDRLNNLDTYVFLYKRDFGLCLRDYFKLTGSPAMIPRYALGIWWQKNEMYSFNDIKNLINDFSKNDIPLSTLLLGEYWHQKDKTNLSRYRSGFAFNGELFADPRAFSTYLHDRGIKLGVNIDPHEGVFTHEPKYNEMALELGINTKMTIPFNMYDLNFVNLYFQKLIIPLYNYGVDMFWIDYYNPKDKMTMDLLNYYHFNDYKRFNNQRGLILSRPNDLAPHRYPIHFSGETVVSWNTLASLPFYNNTSCNIGLSWWSHDIGGFKDGVEDSELYTRYVQLGTFSPIFRFASDMGKYYKREPWRWDSKTLNIVKGYCLLRHRLIPYLYSEGYKYHKAHIPVVKPLYYSVPDLYDEPIYRNEYFFGSELLVAPITVPNDIVMNRSIHRLYLPEGTWYDFNTGKKFQGNKRFIAFYKHDEYPVFAKSGSIIPLAINDNINSTSVPKDMEVHVFPGKSNVYNLYEDDGNSKLFNEGYYIVTRFDYNYLANNYTLIIRPVEGKSGIIPEFRNYKIRFRNTRMAQDVIAMVQEVKYEVKSYVDNNDFIVEVSNVPTISQLTINCKGTDIEIDAIRIINEDIDGILNDLKIKTTLKEEIASIIYSDMNFNKKKVEIRKLSKKGLDSIFIRMFIRLIEFISGI